MTTNKSPLLKTLFDLAEKEFSLSPPEFSPDALTEDDIMFLEKECNQVSKFDPLQLRKTMFNKMAHNEAYFTIQKSEFGRIFIILDDESQKEDMPLELWMRILRLFTAGGILKSSEKHSYNFNVYFLASKSEREFPEQKSQRIEPQNINGGYTYPCSKQSIVIYRAEDATRVLIHELMHAMCLDHHELGVDIVEAETEAWAELIYVAMLSRGKKFIFNALLQRQSEYMRKQNEKVKEYMKDPDSREFPWRYTIGKQLVWERWGVLDTNDSRPYIKIGNSLRLTYPPDNTLKKQFAVSPTSTIL